MRKYGRTVAELTDLLKDIYYCISVNHVDETLTILLWFFALFAFLFRCLSILFLTKREYIKTYGVRETQMIEERRLRPVLFVLIKIKRAFKENLLFLE